MISYVSGTPDPGYRIFFETSTDGMLIAGEHGVLLDANSSACRILARTTEDLVGAALYGLFDPIDERLKPGGRSCGGREPSTASC
ncbi:MAG: PAS domain-containing protein [Actinomycetota bacterium]|nr:PAS domain-containing protein [Actinomycetota bacterium]